MSYNYEVEKRNIFTEKNFKLHTAMRERAFRILDYAGACRCDKINSLPDGCGSADSWTMMAIIDYMVETGELKEITEHGVCRFQDRIFVRGKK